MFRTYNASITLDRLLFEESFEDDETVDGRVAHFNRANKEVGRRPAGRPPCRQRRSPALAALASLARVAPGVDCGQRSGGLAGMRSGLCKDPLVPSAPWAVHFAYLDLT